MILPKKELIFWCTGMSGSGKSKLASHAKIELEKKNLKVLILDGDVIREQYPIHIGFSREDIEKNNLNIAEICTNERAKYNCIIVPIISPIELVRRKIKILLSPKFYLVYLHADLKSLKKRDPKGLYKKAEKGIIDNLIGYSDNNPYDVPKKFDIKIDTSTKFSLAKSRSIFTDFLINKIFTHSP